MKARSIIYLLILITLSGRSYSQIGLNPEAIIISKEDNTGLLSLTNFNSEPYEVNVSIKYGYPAFDTLGRTYINFNDTLTSGRYSLVPFIKAFPKKFVIKPGKEQLVRMLVLNTGGLPDGSYWARVIIRSGPVSKLADTNLAKDISANMKVITELIAPVIFQKGSLQTGLSLESVNCSSDSQSVKVILNLERIGNSPSIGRVSLTIADSLGNRLEDINEPLPVYFDTKRCFVLDRNEFKPGAYVCTVKISDDAQNFPEDRKVRFNEIKRQVRFSVP